MCDDEALIRNGDWAAPSVDTEIEASLDPSLLDWTAAGLSHLVLVEDAVLCTHSSFCAMGSPVVSTASHIGRPAMRAIHAQCNCIYQRDQ